ncbi:hypothetical protein LSAT2_032612, partial [Lamellibrachia satsuma]
MEKNAIMRLNELPCGVKYEFPPDDASSSGEVVYRCIVKVGDGVFDDAGATKKVAKLKAASVAVAALRATGMLAQLEHQQEALKSTKRKQRAQSFAGAPIISPNLGRHVRTNQSRPKNAVMKLNDKYCALQYDVVYGERDARASVKVTVCGKEYIGTGSTKRLAKQEAAEQALRGLGLWTAEDDRAKKVETQVETITTSKPDSDSSVLGLPNSSSCSSSGICHLMTTV